MLNKSTPDKSSARQPYQPEMPATWWNKLWYYRFYILREMTSIFMIWFCTLLMYGMTTIVLDEFYRFVFFLRHPAVVVLNGLTLIAALIHTVTWFNLAPKAANVIVGEKKLASGVIVGAMWLLTLVLSALLVHFFIG